MRGEVEKLLAKDRKTTVLLYFQNYVYGTDDAAAKVSYLDLHNFPDPGMPKLMENQDFNLTIFNLIMFFVHKIRICAVD